MKHIAKGVSVPLSEGQRWSTKEPYNDGDFLGYEVEILALGKEFVALYDLGCDTHFFTKIERVEQFLDNLKELIGYREN